MQSAFNLGFVSMTPGFHGPLHYAMSDELLILALSLRRMMIRLFYMSRARCGNLKLPIFYLKWVQDRVLHDQGADVD